MTSAERTSTRVRATPPERSVTSTATDAPDPANGRHAGAAPVERRAFRDRLALVAVAAAALRATYLAVERDTPVSGDGWVYSTIGRFLPHGAGFGNPLVEAPTALHPPGWSTVLAAPSALGADSIAAHQVVAALLGTLTVVLVGLLGREVAGERAGLLAAGLAAVHPELWLWERELASETLLLPLSVGIVLQAYRYRRRPGLGRAALLGLTGGLLVLTRTEQALLLLVLVVPVVVADREASRLRRLAAVGLAAACALATVTPWLLYNRGRFEEPVLLSTGAGITLQYAYAPATYDGPLLGSGDPGVWRRPHAGDESQSDRLAREAAFEQIRDRPGRLPVVVAAREGRTWGLFRPAQQAELDRAWGNSPRWVYEAGRWTYWMTLPLALLGVAVLRRRRVSLGPLAASVVVVAVYVAVTYGQTRYRVTADLSLVVLAAVAVDHLLRHRRHPAVVDLRDVRRQPVLSATPDGRTGPRRPPERGRPAAPAG